MDDQHDRERASGEADRGEADQREGARGPASPEPLTGALPPPPGRLLARVEEVLEVRLPAAYREFLARGNGGRPRAEHYVDGTTGALGRVAAFLPLAPGAPDSVFEALERHGERLPPGTLPIARDPAGNLLLLAVGEPWSGEVLLWNAADEPEEDAEGNVTWTNVHAVAADFAELLRRFVAD
ncbi:MAG TPA: SMI1/KNR4 family protein [Thermoanaerobaculia bacterium]|nr:SMI1/KNR4 family protein [Thermoanaerobaculia bacterium]